MNANVLVIKKGHIPFFSQRKLARENFRLSFTQTYTLALIFIAFLGTYYVWLLNENATKGYNIRSLQLENKELSFKENLIDIRIAEGKSIDMVMGAPILSKMQQGNAPQFLVQKDQQFTLNK